MSTKTKILVLKMKEIIYTVVFAVMAIILIVLLVLIFKGHSNKKHSQTNTSTYNPGVYDVSIILSSNPVDIEVVVDSEQIKSIDIVNSSDVVTTMYPLISTSLDKIEAQITEKNSTENIDYDDENKYTSIVLVNAINKALSKAKP